MALHKTIQKKKQHMRDCVTNSSRIDGTRVLHEPKNLEIWELLDFVKILATGFPYDHTLYEEFFYLGLLVLYGLIFFVVVVGTVVVRFSVVGTSGFSGTLSRAPDVKNNSFNSYRTIWR